MTDPARSDRLTLAAFLLLVLLAGGNAVGVDIARGELEAYWGAGLRFAGGAAIFGILMAAFRVPAPAGRALVGAVLYGAVGFGAAYGIAFVAIPMTGAGTGQLLLGLVPLLTLILARLHGLERIRPRAVLGSLLAFLGLAVLAADRIAADVPPAGIGLAFLGAVTMAESGVIVKLTPRAHPIATNAVGMLTGAALLLPMSVLVREAWVLPVQQDTWAAVIYLVVLGSVGVFGLNVFVLGRWPASVVAFEFLLIPLATIPFSAVLTGEPITPIMLLGGAVILVGVYIGSLAGERTPLPQPQPADA
ncbi:MAG TPA: DMT family transporter [candidate division Zixibacteria bacterium]|nr:DMT family transporter [candidate division Zixibacteria bacterium]